MSQIWRGFRELGVVTDGISFAFERQGTETVLVTSFGKGHQIYSVNKLRLLFVGSGQRRRTTGLLMHNHRVYIAEGSSISIWKRGKLQATWSHQAEKIAHMFALGDVLITVSRSNLLLGYALNQTKTSIEAAEPLLSLQLPFGSDEVTAICHPNTYLNKLVIGTVDGRLQLWNISTKEQVYSFKKASWNSAVTLIESSPALDVVAVALANGDVHLVNLKLDKVLFSFHVERSPPVSMSFRTDGPPMLAVGCEDGEIALFDLKEQRLLSMLPCAHRTRVTTLHFLPSEPIMVTGSSDNSMKVWIFDRQNGLNCRVLRQRSGHAQPPTFLRHYGGLQNELLLSAGRDSALRLFNTIQDQQNVEFSQGLRVHKKKKQAKGEAMWQIDGYTPVSALGPIRRLAFSRTRERDWDNIVSCHVGDRHVYTWRYEDHVIGSHRVHSTEPQSTCPLAVAVSPCGHFFFLGTEGGWIDCFNIQSGLHRGSYVRAAGKKGAKTISQPAHSKAITGLVCDPLNRYLISAGLDGQLRLWNFGTRALLQTVDIGSPVTLLEGFATTGGLLLAMASDDLSIRVFDIESRRLVRRFRGHTSQITDIGFSPDGRWIVSASTDATLRVWDLPTATMIDWAKVSKPITSLSFSPTGDFLITAHTDSLGLSVWSNSCHFSSVFFRAPSTTPSLLEMHSSSTSSASTSSSSSASSSSSSDELQADDDDDEQVKKPRVSVKPLAPSMVTLSGIVSETHWKNLSELDTIKARNKPKEPPKAPEAAPFFLPSKPGIDFQWDLPKDQEGEEQSSRRPRAHFDIEPPMVTLLREIASSERPWPSSRLIEHLSQKGPSHVDLEFRSIDVGDPEIFEMLIDVFQDLLQQETGSFELCQSYLNLFLSIYSEELLQQPELHDRIKALKSTQELSWLRLESMFQSTLCLVEYFSGLV